MWLPQAGHSLGLHTAKKCGGDPFSGRLSEGLALQNVDHEAAGPHKGPIVVTAESHGKTRLGPLGSPIHGSWPPPPPMVPPYSENRPGLPFCLGWGSLSLWKPKTLQLLPGSNGAADPCGSLGAHWRSDAPVSRGGVHEMRLHRSRGVGGMARLLPAGRVT